MNRLPIDASWQPVSHQDSSTSFPSPTQDFGSFAKITPQRGTGQGLESHVSATAPALLEVEALHHKNVLTLIKINLMG